MRTLTLVTAVAPERAHYLPETAKSVHSTIAFMDRNGWTVDWVLVADGPGKLPRFSSGDNTTMIRLSGRSGVAAARNAALGSVRSEWVMAVDADDLLIASSVLEVVSAAEPEHQWVVFNHVDADTGAPRSAVRGVVGFGPGSLAPTWHRGWPFHPGNVAVRTDAVRAVGGWPATAGCEEDSLLLRLSETYGGVCLPHTALRRRVWEGQRSNDRGWRDTRTDGVWASAEMLNAWRAAHFPGRGSVHPPSR